MTRFLRHWVGALLFIPLPLLAQTSLDKPKESCPNAKDAVTVPAPVVIADVLHAVSGLKTSAGKPAIELSSQLVAAVHDLFDTSKVKTKMEQFFRLLDLLARHANADLGAKIDLDAKPIRDILLKSKVFTDDAIPGRITAVGIDRKESSKPHYDVRFNSPETIVPLNRGEGFYLFRNGKCQHAKHLIFRERFNVEISRNRKGNALAQKLEGVDLFGDFGNRGIIDVDIQYVELRSVEFFKGTNLGKVTAFVSREEFKKNRHNPLLRMITKIVPDRSVQPIDW